MAAVHTVDSIAAEVVPSLDRLVDNAVFEARGSSQPDDSTLEPLAFALTSLLLSSLRSKEPAPPVSPEVRRLAMIGAQEGVTLERHLRTLAHARIALLHELQDRVRGRVGDHRLLLEASRRLSHAEDGLVAALAEGHHDATAAGWAEERSRLESLLAMSAAVNHELDVEAVARAGVAELLRGLKVDAGGLWVVDAEEGLVLVSAVGLNWEENRLLRAVSTRGRWLVSMAACEPEPIQTRFHSGNAVITGFRAAIASRLEREGEVLGVLLLASRRERVYSDAEIAFTSEAVRLLASAIDRAQRHHQEARTDFLTGLANRQEFERAMEREIAGAERHGRPVSLMLIDMDRLKQINDEHGHHAGDVAIRTLAELLRKHLRATDTCARLGGDEFAIAMPAAELQQAEEVGRRLKASLAEASSSGRSVPLEVSIGLAGWQPGIDFGRLFRTADARLYQEKRRHHARHRRQAGGTA